MTPVQIPLSVAKQLGDFEQLVRDYIEAMEAHRFTTGEPAPVAHPLIEAAIMRVQYPVEGIHQPTVTYEEARENGKTVLITEPVGEPVRFMSSNKPDDFVPNYVLIDDTPFPPSLDELKMKRAQEITAEAGKIINQLMPPLKISLQQIQYSSAKSLPNAERTAEQAAFVTWYETQSAKCQAVHYHLAQLQSDLHDLSAEDFETWEPAPFPT